MNSTKTVWGPYSGVVDEVVDGDTIYIKLDLGFDLTYYARVRVEGINAPEVSTDAGKEARAFARKVLPVGTAVIVYSFGWDKYGGRVDGRINDPAAVAEYGTPDFGTIMLDSGHAVPMK